MDALTLYRWGRGMARARIPFLPGVAKRLILHLYGASIPLEAEIGEGTRLGYGGVGVVIHRDCHIGRGCFISHQVTLGGRSGRPGVPRLGNFVRIGAGAKVLGDISLGDFAVVGANAVVTHDVAGGAVVAGVPARELRRESNPQAAYQRDLGLPEVPNG